MHMSVKSVIWNMNSAGAEIEDEAARVEEGLVAAQSESNLLREGGADGVVCRGGEGDVE